MDLRRRALARDSAYNFLGRALPLLVALVAVPPLLRGLGEARFGVLGLVWMFVVFFGEVGLGRAVARYASVARSRGALERVGRIARTGARAQIALGVALGAVLAPATPWLVDVVLGVPGEWAAETRAAFYWLALGAPAILVAAAHRGGLEAAQRFDLINLIRGSASTANFLLPLAALWMGWGLGGMVALLMASRLAVAVLFAFALAGALRREAGASGAGARSREVLDGAAEVPLEDDGLGALLRFGGWSSVSALVSPIVSYADRAILAAVAGVAAVGRYTPPWEAITRLGLIPASVMTALFPAFSALGLGVDPRRIRRLALQGGVALFVLTGIPALVAAVWAAPLLELWLGEGFHPEAALALQILAAGVVLNAIAFIPLGVLQGLGRPEVPAFLHLAQLPVQIALAWWLVSAYGVPGAALAWTVRCGIDSTALWTCALWVNRSRGRPAPRPEVPV